MATYQFAVNVAVFLLYVVVVSATYAEGDIILTPSSSNLGDAHQPQRFVDIQPSTVTVTGVQRTTTVIKTTVVTVVETTVINAATTTTAIITIPVTITMSPVTTVVYQQQACPSQGEAINNAPNSLAAPLNISNHNIVFVSDFVKINRTVDLKSPDIDKEFDKVIRVYPTSLFSSVMASLSQVVAEMKRRGSRGDLVERYEVLSNNNVMYKQSEPRMGELEEMAGEVLDEARKGGHESDAFFERMEKFVGFLETIYAR